MRKDRKRRKLGINGLTYLAAVAVVALLSGSTVRADGENASADDQWRAMIQQQLDSMRKIIVKQQEEITTLKSEAKGVQGGSTASAVDRQRLVELVRQEMARANEKAWFSRWTLKGDFRYRHEWINDGTFPDRQRDRNRHRVRVRLGAFAEVNDEWDVGIQLATGGAGPTGTNQTLDTFFTSKAVFWDLLYARYQPKKIENLQVIFGKMKMPFYEAARDLIWDSDVRPEGIAAKYHVKAAENLTVYFNGGGFWVDERQFDAVSNDTADTSLWAAQIYAKLDVPQVTEKCYVKSGITYYDYGNIEGFPASLGLAGNTGDIARGLNRYAMDYDIWNPFVEVGFPVAKLPFKVFGDLVINSAAEDPQRLPIRPGQMNPYAFPKENDFGWAAGFQLGQAKKPGSWQLAYKYRVLDPDAVVGALSDADFGGGGTNSKGHRVSIGYALAKNVVIAATYLCDEQNVQSHADDDDFRHALQVDLKLKF